MYPVYVSIYIFYTCLNFNDITYGDAWSLPTFIRLGLFYSENAYLQISFILSISNPKCRPPVHGPIPST